MIDVIDRFGTYLSDNVDNHPEKIDTLLTAAYRIYGRFLKTQMAKEKIIGNDLSSSLYGFSESCKWMIRGLEDPQSSAMVNLFFPSEILLAMDINPMFVEGISGFMRATKAERGFIDFFESDEYPKSLCSYHKIALGAVSSQVLSSMPLVMNTTAYCDANQLTFKALSKYWKVPHFQLDVPRGEYRPEKLQYVKEQIQAMVPLIEKTYGKKVDWDRLREVIHLENQTSALQRKAYQLTKTKYFPKTTGEEMNQIFFSHVLKGSKTAYEYYQLLVSDLEEAPLLEEAPHKKIFWIHTLPQAIEGVNDLFDEEGPLLLTFADINLDMIDGLDEEDPILAMAQRVINNVYRPGIEARIFKGLEYAKDLDVDGVIYFNHWGCKLTLGGSQLAKETYDQAGIPTLILEGDGADPKNSNQGQMLTRLEAFAEMLEDRK